MLVNFFSFCRFLAPQLSSYAENDQYLEQHFIVAGWHKNTSDDDLIRNLYLKLTLRLQWQWLHTNPNVQDHLLKRCVPESFHTDKVTAFVSYKDKIFLSHANGTIERRRCSIIPSTANNADKLQEVYTLQAPESSSNPNLNGLIMRNAQNDENHILGRCVILNYKNILF